MENERPIQSNIRVRRGVGGPPSIDGHPGWVNQSVKHYGALCILLLTMHGFITGVYPVLAGARSAAWWSTALGGAMGVLLWLPMWGMMRGKKALTIDEAFSEAFGPVVGGLLTLWILLCLLFDTVLSLRALGSLIRQFLIIQSNERVAAMLCTVAMTVTVYRNGMKGISGYGRFTRTIVIFAFIVPCIVAFKNANIDNLFPVFGNSVPQTLAQIPVAAGGFTSLLMLGILPRSTGSAEPVKFSTGALALLVGCLGATLLVLISNLCMPPMSILQSSLLGDHLMIAEEYLDNRVFRLLFLFAMSQLLLLTAGAGMATAGMLAEGALHTKKKWPLLVFASAVLSLLLLEDNLTTRNLDLLMVYRFPAVLTPCGITWGVLFIKRKRKAAKA